MKNLLHNKALVYRRKEFTTALLKENNLQSITLYPVKFSEGEIKDFSDKQKLR